MTEFEIAGSSKSTAKGFIYGDKKRRQKLEFVA